MNTKHVITLIANPKHQTISEAMTDDMAEAIERAGARVLDGAWLSDGEACDLFFVDIEPEEAEAAARALLGDAPIDVIAQPAGGRQKQLLISDMDSTMITIECIDELADFAGLKAQVSAITERAMNGELDFKAALKERVALLAGLPESVLQEAFNDRVKMMPGARELVQTMRHAGAYCLLVSGGFTFFTQRVREALGFHEDHANLLTIEEGRLTGHVAEPILDRDSKLQSLLNATMKIGISREDVLAVGDGANDLPMLLAAGLGVAYHAKPVVRQSARAQLNHTDLSALLFAQGYKRSDFIH